MCFLDEMSNLVWILTFTSRTRLQPRSTTVIFRRCLDVVYVLTLEEDQLKINSTPSFLVKHYLTTVLTFVLF